MTVGDIHSRQLRRQDSKLADLRRWYEGNSPEQRAKIREGLEKADAATKDLAGGMYLTVKVENNEVGDQIDEIDEIDEFDEFNESGEVESTEADDATPWEDCHFCIWTTLEAIRAWDAGQDFTPHTVLP
jgi:hypothetical protein